MVPTWGAAEEAHGAAQLAEAPLANEHGARLLVLHHLRRALSGVDLSGQKDQRRWPRGMSRRTSLPCVLR